MGCVSVQLTRVSIDTVHLFRMAGENLEAFIKDIVRDVSEKMNSLVPVLCYGCQTNHPSQREHDLCLMATEEERMVTTFYPAWKEMNQQYYLERLGELILDRLTVEATKP